MAKDKEPKPKGLVKRAAPSGAGANPNPLWDEAELNHDLPSLFCFLHDSTYSDGSVRLPGSITLFNKYGSLIAAVNDNDRNIVAYVSAPSWSELLAMIDEGISNDSLAWKARVPQQSSKQPPF